MDKPVLRRIIFTLTRLGVAGVAIITFLFFVNDSSFRILRKIRPVLDVARDEWIQGYIAICIATVVIVCILSILFYLLETFAWKTANRTRCVITSFSLFFVAVAACAVVFFILPFNNEMAPLVYGIICGIVLLQIIIHRFAVPPANYQSLW